MSYKLIGVVFILIMIAAMTKENHTPLSNTLLVLAAIATVYEYEKKKQL